MFLVWVFFVILPVKTKGERGALFVEGLGGREERFHLSIHSFTQRALIKHLALCKVPTDAKKNKPKRSLPSGNLLLWEGNNMHHTQINKYKTYVQVQCKLNPRRWRKLIMEGEGGIGRLGKASWKR